MRTGKGKKKSSGCLATGECRAPFLSFHGRRQHSRHVLGFAIPDHITVSRLAQVTALTRRKTNLPGALYGSRRLTSVKLAGHRCLVSHPWQAQTNSGATRQADPRLGGGLRPEILAGMGLAGLLLLHPRVLILTLDIGKVPLKPKPTWSLTPYWERRRSLSDAVSMRSDHLYPDPGIPARAYLPPRPYQSLANYLSPSLMRLLPILIPHSHCPQPISDIP